MLTEYVAALTSVILISSISLVGLAIFSIKTSRLNRAIYYLLALSVGALFGDTVIHILPEVYKSGVDPIVIGSSILFGIFLFFVLEKYLNWMHRHNVEVATEHSDHQHIEPIGYLSLASDSLHNFIDGMIIGASYLVGIEIGIATTLAIAVHELPHEIGDYSLLIFAGFSRSKALLYNFISALTAVLGTILVLYYGLINAELNGIVLSVAAGGFIYIAGSDLVPELHKTVEIKKSLIQFLFIAIGIALMYLLLFTD